MPSKNGPYAVAPNGTGFSVVDKNGTDVVEFDNGKEVIRVRYGSYGLSAASAVAVSLTNDDTAYLALTRSHFLGFGGVSTDTSAEVKAKVAAAILLIETATFASDPVAVSALALLTAGLAL